MSIRRLRSIKSLYFTYQDLADHLHISPQSAMVACSRYVQSKDLVRLKRNCYILREKWNGLKDNQRYTLIYEFRGAGYPRHLKIEIRKETREYYKKNRFEYLVGTINRLLSGRDFRI